MTIATTTNKALGLGNGVTTAFTYGFVIPALANVQVTFIDTDGSQTVLSPSAYSVSGLGSASGGTVNYPLAGAPIASATSLLIERVMPYTQPTVLRNQSGFYPAVVEAMADNLEMQIQQLATGSRNSTLALVFPSVDVAPATVLPIAAARANKYLAFDANGNPQMLSGTNSGGDVSTSTAKATGSSYSRTLALRFADKINVLDFHALGDGATDDTVQVQAAATAAAGKTLFFPPGYTFVLSSVSILANTTVEMFGSSIKQKVLGNLVSSATFVVTGTGCQFLGGSFNGQRALQPANGYSDSFNGGSNGTGRAFRAAILADQNANPAIASLTVRNVSFTGQYGACVACRDVSNIIVEDCIAATTNFELAAAYRNTGTLVNISYQRNICTAIGTGDPTVNADCMYAARYSRVVVAGNKASAFERCLVKLESCQSYVVTGNVAESNTINNFPAIQIDGANTAKYGVVSNNALYNCQCGILLSSGTYDGIVISGNQIFTTTGPGTADAISVSATGTVNGLLISNNVLYDIKRHALNIAGLVNGLTIQGNNCDGQATGGQFGMILNASGGDFSDVLVRGNVWRQFEQSAVGSGVCTFSRTGAFVIRNMVFQGNIINAGGAANRALRTNGIDLFANGIISDNYIDGLIDLYSASLRYRNNTVTGVVGVPAGSANVEVKGATQLTVGGIGGAAAVPSNASGYSEIIVNGVAYVTPFFLKV